MHLLTRSRYEVSSMPGRPGQWLAAPLELGRRCSLWGQDCSGPFVFYLWLSCACLSASESKEKKKVKSLNCVWLFVIPWISHQTPLSMEFSRQDYWSGLPFPSPKRAINVSWLTILWYSLGCDSLICDCTRGRVLPSCRNGPLFCRNHPLFFFVSLVIPWFGFSLFCLCCVTLVPSECFHSIKLWSFP